MAALTFQELYDIGQAESLSRRPKIAFRPGDVSDMVLGGAAAIGDRVTGYAADRFKATYVSGAKGQDLTQLADDHWGITRIAAVKASGQVTITRTNATAVAFTLIAGSVVATARDTTGAEIRYVLTAPAAWAASENSAKTVAAEAETAGPAGNTTPNTVVRIISPTLEGTYTLTGSTAFAGGTPEETDEQLRERIRLFPATLRRGTLAALEYGARSAPGAGVRYATATESVTGLVTIYVTDTDGNSTGTDVACSPSVVDDGTMTHKVAVELETWRAAGALVVVSGGAILTVDVNVTLTVRAGVAVAQLITKITAAIAAEVARLKIGETLYRTSVSKAVKNVHPAAIVEAVVTMRVGADAYASVDIAPATPNQILRAGAVAVI